MLSPEELRDVSDADLDSLAEGVEKELNRRKRRRTREVVRQAKQMLAAAGFDVQLVPLGSLPEKERGKPETVKHTPIPPGLYQNPDNPDETWRPGSRGRFPKWITDALEAGSDLSDLRVEEEGEAA